MATSPGIPEPHPMNIKEDLANNWEFFKEPSTNYAIVTKFRHKNEKN